MDLPFLWMYFAWKPEEYWHMQERTNCWRIHCALTGGFRGALGARPPLLRRYFQNHALFRQKPGKTPYFEQILGSEPPWPKSWIQPWPCVFWTFPLEILNISNKTPETEFFFLPLCQRTCMIWFEKKKLHSLKELDGENMFDSSGDNCIWSQADETWPDTEPWFQERGFLAWGKNS